MLWLSELRHPSRILYDPLCGVLLAEGISVIASLSLLFTPKSHKMQGVTHNTTLLNLKTGRDWS